MRCMPMSSVAFAIVIIWLDPIVDGWENLQIYNLFSFPFILFYLFFCCQLWLCDFAMRQQQVNEIVNSECGYVYAKKKK